MECKNVEVNNFLAQGLDTRQEHKTGSYTSDTFIGKPQPDEEEESVDEPSAFSENQPISVNKEPSKNYLQKHLKKNLKNQMEF